MSVPNTFASATSAIPLANLDADFAYYDAAFQIVGTAMEVNYTFRLEDLADPTKKGEFVLSGITTGTTRQYTLPNATGTLATLANTSQTFLGSTVFAPSTNSGTITIGGIPQTGTVTLGRSTASQTIDIAVGATTAASTKTVNIGTTGVSTSTTNINYGSSVTGALVTHIWNAGANNMRLDSSGNLGIGTTSPVATKRLHVADVAAGSGMRVSGPVSDNAWAGGIEFFSNNATTVTSSIIVSTGGMIHSYGGSERMRLDSSGNLLVGTTSSPAAASALGKIVRVGGVNIEGTNQIIVGTTFVDITKNINTGTFVYVSGYRSPGGQQAVWVLLAQGSTVNVISTINASAITASFQIAGGKVQMKASADSFVICAASLTTNL